MKRPIIEWDKRLREYEKESKQFFSGIDTAIEKCDAALAGIKRTREKIDESLLAGPR